MASLAMSLMVAAVTATFMSAVSGATGIQTVLTLERAFPVDEKVELEVITARDRGRHARMLQAFSGGVVDFRVVGSSDPYIVG